MSARERTQVRGVTTYRHRVAFFDTDAMGIVHHANYVRFFELARIAWLDEHDRPYREYVAQDRHFATTHVSVHYANSATFDQILEVDCWLEWVRGASLRMAYEIRRGALVLVTGFTDHAMVDGTGRPRRIPKERRLAMHELARRPKPSAAAPRES